jgi:integrase
MARNRGPMRPALIDFLFYTGARIGEAASAEWIDDRGYELTIRGQKDHAERAIAIHPRLRDSLDALRVLRVAEGRGEEPAMFGRNRGTLYYWVRNAAEDAGIDDVHPHTLRATTATVLAESGASARDIQRILGHSSLAVTERYIASTRSSRAKTITLL